MTEAAVELAWSFICFATASPKIARASGRDADRAAHRSTGKHKLRKSAEARAQSRRQAHADHFESRLSAPSKPRKSRRANSDINARSCVSDRLTPDSSPPDVWTEIRAHRDEPSILLAGHEPLFSATVGMAARLDARDGRIQEGGPGAHRFLHHRRGAARRSAMDAHREVILAARVRIPIFGSGRNAANVLAV